MINTQQAIFDVPALIGKNIDEIKIILGAPSDLQPEPLFPLQTAEWNNSFQKQGRTLLVTFEPQTRKIVDFFIEVNRPSGAADSYSDLLPVCNVIKNSTRYSIEPVRWAKYPNKFLGIRIVAK